MNKLTRSSLLPLLLAALLLFGCRFFTPSTGNKAGQTPNPSGGNLLPDPTSGLASLQSYHASLQQDVSGALDAKPFERHTYLVLTRVQGQADFSRDIRGSEETPSYLRAIQTDQAAYRWNSPDEACQGEPGALQPGEVVEPASLLLPITKSTRVGSETVNGIAAVHYHFDESGLSLAAPKPSVNGDVWLAEDGSYVVKYTLFAAQPAKLTGKGMEVGQSLTYELSQVNSAAALSLPQPCMAVPADLPVPPDAANVLRASGLVEFATQSSAAQVVDFYYKNLAPLGWTTAREQPTGDLKLPLGLQFDRGELSLGINLDEAESGVLDVTLVVYSAAQQAASAPTGQPTAAGPQPTIDASTTGLPDDVPLYPGSTALMNLGGMGVGFNAPDSPEVVAAFYKDKMAAQGWTLFVENSDGGQVTQVWQKVDRVASIAISVTDGQTSVVLMLSKM